jgi:DNA-binding beta-propeller fold protein YncE
MPGRTLVLVVGSLVLAACGDDGDAGCPELPGHGCTWLGKAGEQSGFNGDRKHRLDTEIYWSMDLMFTRDGVAWFIDWNNHLVRRVLADDTVETVVGDPLLFPGDGTGDERERSAEGAPGLEVRLNHPTEFALAPDGSLLLMAWHNHKLRRIDPTTGRVWIVSGDGVGFKGDGGPAEAALYKQPKSLVAAADGTLYVGDQGNFRVRRIDPDGMIATIVGSGVQGASDDGQPASGPASEANLCWEFNSNSQPSGGLALSPDGGTLYLADTLCHRIRAVDLASMTITTIAGTGEAGFAGDGGAATAARLHAPRDLEVGPDGDLYVADTDNNVVRAIDLDGDGAIRSVVGQGGDGGLEEREGVPAGEVLLRRPHGLAFDPAGDLYVMDTVNNRIVKVTR